MTSSYGAAFETDWKKLCVDKTTVYPWLPAHRRISDRVQIRLIRQDRVPLSKYHCNADKTQRQVSSVAGAGIAQWLERRTRDRKVAGSNPCRSGGRIFFSRVNFLCWLLFRYPFHPCVTAVARKRPRSFCRSAGGMLQLNTHNTLRMWLCMKWHGAWLYGIHRTRRDGCSFMWHQPCQRCKYTTSVDIQKRAIKSYSLM